MARLVWDDRKATVSQVTTICQRCNMQQVRRGNSSRENNITSMVHAALIHPFRLVAVLWWHWAFPIPFISSVPSSDGYFLQGDLEWSWTSLLNSTMSTFMLRLPQQSPDLNPIERLFRCAGTGNWHHSQQICKLSCCWLRNVSSFWLNVSYIKKNKKRKGEGVQPINIGKVKPEKSGKVSESEWKHRCCDYVTVELKTHAHISHSQF